MDGSPATLGLNIQELLGDQFECPKCGHRRLQHGYTRAILFNLLNTRRNIDAYCSVCNVCWPITESERRMI